MPAHARAGSSISSVAPTRRATEGGVVSVTRSMPAAVNGTSSAPSADASSPSRNGLPPVAIAHACANAGRPVLPCGAKHASDLLGRQPPDRDDLRAGAVTDRAQHRGLTPIAADPDEHCDRQGLDSPGEVRREAQRGLVRPVCIVDHDQDRALLGQIGGEPEQPVQELLRRPRQALGHLGHDAARTRGRAAERTSDVPHDHDEALPHDSHRELVLERRAAPREDPHPGRRAMPRATASRLVLPMPAGPSTNTVLPAPSRAASSAAPAAPARCRAPRAPPLVSYALSSPKPTLAQARQRESATVGGATPATRPRRERCWRRHHALACRRRGQAPVGPAHYARRNSVDSSAASVRKRGTWPCSRSPSSAGRCDGISRAPRRTGRRCSRVSARRRRAAAGRAQGAIHPAIQLRWDGSSTCMRRS